MDLTVIRDGFFYVKYNSLSGKRLRLPVNIYLIRDQGKNILVDTGPGSSGLYDRGKYDVIQPRNLIRSLNEQELNTDDIDVVINTHLHFDHSDGNFSEDGNMLFKKALHIISKIEWDGLTSSENNIRKERFLKLDSEKKLKLIYTDCQITDNVTIIQAPGHSEGFQYVCATGSDGIKHIIAGDIIPTVWHLNNSNSEEIDFNKEQLGGVKRSILDNAAAENSLIYYQHSSSILFSRIKIHSGKYSVER